MEGNLHAASMPNHHIHPTYLQNRRQALRTLLTGAAGLALAPATVLAASSQSAFDLALQAQGMLSPDKAGQAVKLLEQALEVEPGLLWARGLLARAFYLNNQHPQALEQVREVLAHTPNDPMARMLLELLTAEQKSPVPQVSEVAEAPHYKHLVVIDPGHGGLDPGAMGPSGLLEKDVTMDIAMRTVQLAKELVPDVRVVLTRTGDYHVPLQARAVLANYHEADLFISLHVNAYSSENARGLETFRCADKPSSPMAARVAAMENDVPQGEGSGSIRSGFIDIEDILFRFERTGYWTKGQAAAKAVQKHLATELDMQDRGVHAANFAVLRHARMPALLIEAGFITNPHEEAMLASVAGREVIARGLCTSLARCDEEILV